MRLARAGFLAAREEARELVEAAQGDHARLHHWVARRLEGEPLAWLTGFVTFLGHRVRVDRGVYVPRPQSEVLAVRAIERLRDRGVAADLCTGSGAIAVAMQRARPGARVVASDIDPVACRCAAKNRVEVYQGDLADHLPEEMKGRFDVVVAVVPYVPTNEMVFLPRDVRAYEPRLALDGGTDGVEILESTVRCGSRLLCRGGSLLLELGGRQDEELASTLVDEGFEPAVRLCDGEGDLRGIETVRL